MKKRFFALSFIAVFATAALTGCSGVDMRSYKSSSSRTGSVYYTSSEFSVGETSEIEVSSATTTTVEKVSSAATASKTTSSKGDKKATSSKSLEVKSAGTYSLSSTPLAEEKKISMTTDTVSVNFDAPESGYLKLLAYELSGADGVKLFATFKDASGKVLYKDISIDNGYTQKYLIPKGRVSIELTCKNKPKKMSGIALSWAFAANTTTVTELTLGKTASAVVNSKGIAEFKLLLKHNSLVSVKPIEACLYEGSCTFYVKNSSGKRVTDDIAIETTEWISRKVFLPKGNYTIVVMGVDAVATCEVTTNATYNDIELSQASDIKLPATFGFTKQNAGKRTVKFTPTSSQKTLIVDPDGVNTYYDSSQTVDVTVTDSKGNTVEETCEGKTSVDISSLSGTLTVSFTVSDSCVVKLSLSK